MDISLSSEMEKFVVDKIRSGQYASASEVVQGQAPQECGFET